MHQLHFSPRNWRPQSSLYSIQTYLRTVALCKYLMSVKFHKENCWLVSAHLNTGDLLFCGLIKAISVSERPSMPVSVFTLTLAVSYLLFFSSYLISAMASLAAPMWQVTRWRSWTFCPMIWSSTWSSRLSPPACWCLKRMKKPSS